MIFDRNEKKEVIALLGTGYAVDAFGKVMACLHDSQAYQSAAGNEGSGNHVERKKGEDQYDQPGRDCHAACL